MTEARIGLRLRIAIAMAIACLLIVGALGFTLYTASEEMEESLIDQLIAEEMDYLIARHRENPGYQPQRSSNLQSYVVRNASEHDKLPPFLLGLAAGRHEFFVGQEETHALVKEAGGVRYVVAYEVGLHEQREREFKLLILFSALASTTVSLALGFWLSGVLVRQLTELAKRVGALRPDQGKDGLARPGQDPEIALLASALDDYRSRMEKMIRREQEFTSNASHEMRTPLTAIETSCELLLADGTLNEKSRARVEWIAAAASRMTDQIQSLLFLARGQALGEIEPVAIADCVEEALEPCRAEIARKGLALELDMARDAVLDLNYPALRLVLVNLVRNAVQYTERGTIRIGYAVKRLTVSDSGRGIAADHLSRVFERFFRGASDDSGEGIGLALVKAICDHYGWTIEVDSRQGQGSTFAIAFP